MDNIHAPTVPSGLTSSAGINDDLTRMSLQELQTKKQNMEGEMQALSLVLDSHGADMNTSLTTVDGFPRADIDVAQVRTTRARIIRLRNDYKGLMGLIEERLHQHFALLEDSQQNQMVADQPIMSSTTQPRPDPPFASVTSVVSGSPAERAGLKPGDRIRNFGHVNFVNHDNLRKVAECVQANEGGNVTVNIFREAAVGSQHELRLSLRPMQGWGGRGLLGCHILPL